MPPLRLLADDLTGALDSAARFIPLTGPVAVIWREPASGIRSHSIAAPGSCRRIAAHARIAGPRVAAGWRGSCIQEDRQPAARPCGAGTRHLHGPVRPLRAGTGVPLPRPHHARWPATCAGHGDAWRDTGVDLQPRNFVRMGVAANCGMRRPTLTWMLSSPMDGSSSGRVLWCGTGGLAGALAGHGRCHGPSAAADPGADRQRPSGQPRAGRRRSAGHANGGRRLRSAGGTGRREARLQIGQAFSRAAAARCSAPARCSSAAEKHCATCATALGATRLEVDGEVGPGVPTSLLRAEPGTASAWSPSPAHSAI